MGLDYKKTLSPTTMLNELKSVMFWRDIIVEAISCSYVMIAVILVLITTNAAAYTPGVTHFGVFAGLLVFIVIEGYGPVGGATLSPAVPWALFLAGHITPFRMITLIASQIGGTAVGAAIGYGLTPESKRANFPALQPSDELTDVQCVMVEACLTFNLLFVGLSVNNWKSRTPGLNGLPALSGAFCIGVGIFAAGTHTGGLQNPMIPFGPSILNGKWVRHWIYWAGPFSGGAIGALTYELTQWITLRYSVKEVSTQSDKFRSLANRAESHMMTDSTSDVNVSRHPDELDDGTQTPHGWIDSPDDHTMPLHNTKLEKRRQSAPVHEP